MNPQKQLYPLHQNNEMSYFGLHMTGSLAMAYRCRNMALFTQGPNMCANNRLLQTGSNHCTVNIYRHYKSHYCYQNYFVI